jgi:hypothetical protein
MDLRSEQNYSWSSEGNLQHSLLREVFARDLQRDLGEPYTRSRYYHLYVDGVYWGVSQTQERVEEFYGESYFGGDQQDYDVVKSGLADVGGTQLNAGNDAAWFQLFTLAQNLANSPAANANNFWTMQGLNPDGTRNPSLPVLLDVDNLIDYMLIIFYTGGYDTGISAFLGDDKANNWYGIYNRVAANQGFQFFMHDNEHSLGAESTLHGTQFIDRTGPFNLGNQSVYAQFNPAYLHQDLLAHPEYRQRIIEKAQEYFFNGGPMTPAASIARMQQRIPQVEGAIIAEAARWGDAQTPPTPRTKATWQAEVNWLLNTYFPGRTSTVVNQLRTDGLYVARPIFTPASGPIGIGSLATISAPGNLPGNIYYTTDGVTDPRNTGGAINASAKVYNGGVPINQSLTIKARYRTATGAWSTLVEATFTATTQGDYDGDQRVDGSDFLAWQRTLGEAAIPAGAGADGNHDGAINAADLTAWRANFGKLYAAPAVSQTAAATSQSLVSLDEAYASLAAYASLRAIDEEPALDQVASDEASPMPEQRCRFLPAARDSMRPLPVDHVMAPVGMGFDGILDSNSSDDAVDLSVGWRTIFRR